MKFTSFCKTVLMSEYNRDNKRQKDTAIVQRVGLNLLILSLETKQQILPKLFSLFLCKL